MDLEARKYEFIKKLFNVEESVFEKLETLLNKVVSNRISLKQYNKEIDEANKRIDTGDLFTQDEVEKMINEW